MDEVVAALPATAWQRLTVAEGSQGPRVYEYAEVWVWFSRGACPARGNGCWSGARWGKSRS